MTKYNGRKAKQNCNDKYVYYMNKDKVKVQQK